MPRDTNRRGGGWTPMTRTTLESCEAVSDNESEHPAAPRASLASSPRMGTDDSAMPTGQSTTTSARDIPKGRLFSAGAYAAMMAESDSDSEDDYAVTSTSGLFRPVPRKAMPRQSPEILKASSLTKVFPGAFDDLPDTAMGAIIEKCEQHRRDAYADSSASEVEEISEVEEDGSDEEEDKGDEEHDMDPESDSDGMADSDGKDGEDDEGSSDGEHVQKQDAANAVAHRR